MGDDTLMWITKVRKGPNMLAFVGLTRLKLEHSVLSDSKHDWWWNDGSQIKQISLWSRNQPTADSTHFCAMLSINSKNENTLRSSACNTRRRFICQKRVNLTVQKTNGAQFKFHNRRLNDSYEAIFNCNSEFALTDVSLIECSAHCLRQQYIACYGFYFNILNKHCQLFLYTDTTSSDKTNSTWIKCTRVCKYNIL